MKTSTLTGSLLALLPLSVVWTAPAAAQASPDDQKALELVQRIRRGMREVDQLLLSGAEPGRTAEAVEATARRIEELLDEAESKSSAVVQSLEELIRMAKSSSSSSQCPDGPPDPSQQPQSSDQKRDKSQDPSELQPQGEQQDPQQPQDSKEQKPQDHQGQDPKSPKPDESPPAQRPAERNPSAESGVFERVDVSGRWGLLPPKEAEDLQRYSIEEFPQRYRHWMDLYYRRVSSRDTDR